MIHNEKRAPLSIFGIWDLGFGMSDFGSVSEI
jgi:hypothetical protein